MREGQIKFLKRLIDTPSPSGFEGQIQNIISEEMQSYVDSIATDVMGNLIGTKNESGEVKVMLASHCDEIGFIVKYISDDGFLFFDCIGKIDVNIVPAQRVHIHAKNGPIMGVTGKKSVPLIDLEDRNKGVRPDEQWIDIGAKNKKDAEKYISVGDPVTFSSGLEMMGDDLLVSRGLDDKIGVFVIAGVLDSLAGEEHDAAVYAVSSVQEEVGMRGVRTCTYKIKPHIGIVVDVGLATDFPGIDYRKTGECKLNEGPIFYKGGYTNSFIEELLIDTAIKENIPFQFAVSPNGTGTDTDAIQLSREGIATATVNIPIRYLHTPVEIVSMKDVEHTINLIAHFIRKIKKDIQLSI